MSDPDSLIAEGERLLAGSLSPADRSTLLDTLQAATAGVAGADAALPGLIRRIRGATEAENDESPPERAFDDGAPPGT